MKKLLLIPLLFLSFVRAETIQCKIASVHNGDSIICLTDDKKQIKISLFQIDAPELGQPYGQKAKQALSSMVYGEKLVDIDIIKKDKYKRSLTKVSTIYLYGCCTNNDCTTCYENVEDISLEMIKQGYA